MKNKIIITKIKNSAKSVNVLNNRFALMSAMLIFSAFITASIICIAGCTQTTSSSTDADYYNMEFHRGGRDNRPENTLYSYAYALENGATTIECDMQMTADGEIVLSHNPMLNPDITKDKSGNYVKQGQYDIRTMTLDQVREFDVGFVDNNTEYYKTHGRTQSVHSAKIPTLNELFDLIEKSGNKNVKVDAEFKLYPDKTLAGYSQNNVDTEKFVNKVNEVVCNHKMENRFIAQSFDWASLVAMKNTNSNIKTSALYSEEPSEDTGNGTLKIGQGIVSPWLAGINIANFENNPAKAAHSLGIDILSPQHTETNQQLVDTAHQENMKVVVWTVNTNEDMEKMYNMGVDGIMSDRGNMLRDFLESKNVKLPDKTTFDSEYVLEKIGIAWNPKTKLYSDDKVLLSVRTSGAEPVLFGQVMDNDLTYENNKLSSNYVGDKGELNSDAAKIVRDKTYKNSNVKDFVKGFSKVIFTGGEDVSPSLYREPQDVKMPEVEIQYNPERDVSDYLLMSYCIDNNLKVMGICRGMQVLGVVSGASLLQDIPTYFSERGIVYDNTHRTPRELGDDREYAHHNVDIIDSNSHIACAYNCNTLTNAPSWHHQAVGSVNDTNLKVTSQTNTQGINIVESIERTDKDNVFGIQFHPELSVRKNLYHAPNASDFMDYSSALAVFQYFVGL